MPEATSVHTEETGAPPSANDSYRAFRLSFNADEYHPTYQLYSHLDKTNGTDKCFDLTHCRTKAWFVRDRTTDRVTILSNACRLRWCPLCSQGRSNYLTNAITPWVTQLNKPKFLTLTLKHTDQPLTDQVTKLYQDFRLLRQHRQMKPYLRGGIWFFQVKFHPETNQWHPHLHVVLDSHFIPQAWLSRLWLRITRSSNIVDIRCVYKPRTAASYVARYAARPADFRFIPPDRHLDLFTAMHGRKLVGKWGSASAVSLSPPKDPDLERYVKLGRWSTVLSMKDSNPVALSILRAWTTHQPIDPQLTLMDYEMFIDDLPAPSQTAIDSPPSPQQQHQFW